MAKKHIVFNETVNDEQTIIYFINNEESSKKQYFVLSSIPEKYQKNRKALERINLEVQKYNSKICLWLFGKLYF